MPTDTLNQVNILFCAWNRDEIWETDYIVDTIIPPGYIKLYSHIPPHEILSLTESNFDVFVYNCRNNTYDFILDCVKKIKPKVIIHLSDEYHFENLNYWNNLGNYCDLFLRQHHHPGFQYTSNTIQMPLGYCNDAGILDKEMIPINKRIFDWSFLGDMKHDRWEMVESFKSRMPSYYTGCFVAKDRMIDIYMQSVFVPNGRGNSSLNCFRLYEASMCGSIPVVVGDISEIEETFKYEESPPWLIFNSWEEASEKCCDFLQDKDFLIGKQKEIINWWENRISNIHKRMTVVFDDKKTKQSKKKLSFVLIGANDGNDQYLKYFKNNNIDFSSAVLVEPIKEKNEIIKDNYKEFSNVHIDNRVVLDQQTSYFTDPGCNTVSFYEHLDASHISSSEISSIIYHEPWYGSKNVVERRVDRTSLENIFNHYKIKECDWVAIDVEGSEGKIILTFDWVKHRVSRIEFEKIHLGPWGAAINAYLTSQGYIQVPPLSPDEDVAYENPRIIKQKDPLYCIDKLKNFPKVHYVSVVDDAARRDLLHKKFLNYGVSENKLIPHLFERYNDEDHNVVLNTMEQYKLSIGSRGPVTSHLKAIREWYESTDESYAFFCEDDLSLETVKYWDFTWQEFFDFLPNDWDCVQLVLLRESFNLFSNGLRNRCWCDWSACAYLITRRHAKNLIENYYPFGSDTFYLDNKSIDLHGRRESLQIPVVETTIFTNFGDGGIYSCPLFLEDVVNCNSSYINLMGSKVGQCDVNHENSYKYYLNWWVTEAQFKDLEHIRVT